MYLYVCRKYIRKIVIKYSIQSSIPCNRCCSGVILTPVYILTKFKFITYSKKSDFYTTYQNKHSIGILDLEISSDCQFRGHLESKAKLASKKLGVINRARQYFRPTF
ncbi:unnamed protein product [Leptidea sinapis]|uniref:Uncharacterized protein n=1 Tax=Leptidea sinapis TaxID=189913 RepID=A0A5E4QEX1_9NEOP|nr:unnamed protein product [Leptidea sinapis]